MEDYMYKEMNNGYPIYPMYTENDLYTPEEYMGELYKVNPQLENYPEVWRPITKEIVPDIIEGYYSVSTFGRIYTHVQNRLMPVYLRKTNREDPNDGYLIRPLTLENKGRRTFPVHRLVLMVFCPIPVYLQNQLQGNHLDEIKTHNWIWNLEWATPKDNILYSVGTGTIKSGGDCTYATITNEQADRIGYLIATTNLPLIEIANIIGCHEKVVQNIARGTNWRKIYDKYNLGLYRRKVENISDEKVHEICHIIQEYIKINGKAKYGERDKYISEIAKLANIPDRATFVRRLYDKSYRIDICNLYDY